MVNNDKKQMFKQSQILEKKGNRKTKGSLKNRKVKWTAPVWQVSIFGGTDWLAFPLLEKSCVRLCPTIFFWIQCLNIIIRSVQSNFFQPLILQILSVKFILGSLTVLRGLDKKCNRICNFGWSEKSDNSAKSWRWRHRRNRCWLGTQVMSNQFLLQPLVLIYFSWKFST